MSGYECQEPGCDFKIYATGPILTDEDMEAQDYYDQTIEDHEHQHEEAKMTAPETPALAVNRGPLGREELSRLDDEAFVFRVVASAAVGVDYEQAANLFSTLADAMVRTVRLIDSLGHSDQLVALKRVLNIGDQLEDVPGIGGGLFVAGSANDAIGNGRDIGQVNPDVLIHETSPSVGAPNGAGVGTSDPTGGDEAGVPGDAPGAPGK